MCTTRAARRGLCKGMFRDGTALVNDFLAPFSSQSPSIVYRQHPSSVRYATPGSRIVVASQEVATARYREQAVMVKRVYPTSESNVLLLAAGQPKDQRRSINQSQQASESKNRTKIMLRLDSSYISTGRAPQSAGPAVITLANDDPFDDDDDDAKFDDEQDYGLQQHFSPPPSLQPAVLRQQQARSPVHPAQRVYYVNAPGAGKAPVPVVRAPAQTQVLSMGTPMAWRPVVNNAGSLVKIMPRPGESSLVHRRLVQRTAATPMPVGGYHIAAPQHQAYKVVGGGRPDPLSSMKMSELLVSCSRVCRVNCAS